MGFAALPASAFDAAPLHERFTGAFNARDWEGVRTMLADGIVFHRGNGDTAFVGPDAVMDRWQATIGAPDQWNVKFAILDSTSAFEGNDGRVVERGDFAITAGADDGACYRGSYMMTWAPAGDDWRLQLLSWQDVQTDMVDCEA
jgi:ketosteroid isomerase-like protein